MTTYTLKITVAADVDTAESRVREALAAEGFGILTEIDLQATLKEKTGADLSPYVILGACRPPLAEEAVAIDPDIGALLPCNVVVRQSDAGTEIVAVDPDAMLAMSPAGDALTAVARDAKERLERALAAVVAAEA